MDLIIINQKNHHQNAKSPLQKLKAFSSLKNYFFLLDSTTYFWCLKLHKKVTSKQISWLTEMFNLFVFFVVQIFIPFTKLDQLEQA
jgi:hypothetical protein